MALHPEVQEQVAAELRQAGMLATPAKPEPRELTWADTSSLPYLDAVRMTATASVQIAWLGSYSYSAAACIIICQAL